MIMSTYAKVARSREYYLTFLKSLTKFRFKATAILQSLGCISLNSHLHNVNEVSYITCVWCLSQIFLCKRNALWNLLFFSDFVENF